MTTERWVPIPGYEGLYEVSDLGRVRSLDRVIVASDRLISRTGQILKAVPNKAGYPCVHLPRPGMSAKTTYVHRLVLAALVGPLPEGQVTRHLNGNHGDCRLTNLAYGTWSENGHDRVRHGVDHNSRKTHCVNGHPYTAPNLIIRPRGGRDCRECRRRVNQRYDARRRSA